MNQITRLFMFFLFSLSSVFAQSDDFVFSPINVLQGLSDNQVRYILQLPDGRMVFKTSGNINILSYPNNFCIFKPLKQEIWKYLVVKI